MKLGQGFVKHDRWQLSAESEIGRRLRAGWVISAYRQLVYNVKRGRDFILVDVIHDVDGKLTKQRRRLSDGTYRKFCMANVLPSGTSRKVRRAGAQCGCRKD